MLSLSFGFWIFKLEERFEDFGNDESVRNVFCRFFAVEGKLFNRIDRSAVVSQKDATVQYDGQQQNCTARWPLALGDDDADARQDEFYL